MSVDKPSQVLVALGSNLGDKTSHLKQAIAKLGPSAQILRQSATFRSAPIGPADQEFLNLAIKIQTNLSPQALLKLCKQIEKELGRTEVVRWGNRSIDLDIIAWRNPDGTTCELATPELTIPHTEYRNRNFVLLPCAEIAPRWKCAVNHPTLAALAKECLPLEAVAPGISF